MTRQFKPQSDRRSLLFLSLVYYPDTSATSVLMSDLFKRLGKRGVGITVLCGFPSKDDPVAARRLPREEMVDGVLVRRCGLRVQGKRSALTRFLAYTSFLCHAVTLVGRFGKGSIVVGGTDPPFTPVVLWAASLIRSFQYDCMIFDLYPDGLEAVGLIRRGSTVARCWRYGNRLAFLRARRVIVIGRDMAERLIARYRVPKSSLRYVPHWAIEDLDLRSETGVEMKENLKAGDRFVVRYSGNMGLWHDIDGLVLAASLLRGDPQIRIVLTGNGLRRGHAERLAGRIGVPAIVWNDFVPREGLRTTISECDCGLVSLRDGLHGVAVPSKLYGIMAMGRAVIAQVPPCSEVARTITDARCGVVVPPGDPCALAGAIRTLARDRQLCRDMGRRARLAYEAQYSLDCAVETLEDVWFGASSG